MAALPFPSILRPTREAWSPRGGARSGGQTFEGTEQAVEAPTAAWRATVTYPCRTREAVLAMRSVLDYGRAQTWLVGPCDCYFAPRASDGTVPAFALAANAALNSTSLTLSRSASAVLSPGMTFSIGNRLHRIVALPSGDTGSGNVAVTIRPWLRAAYSAGQSVEFAAPVGTMRLASPDTGEMMLDLSRMGIVTIEWAEAA